MLVHNLTCKGTLTINNYNPFDIIPVLDIIGQELVITSVELREKKLSKIEKLQFSCSKCKRVLLDSEIPHLECRECGRIKPLTEYVVLTQHNIVMCENCHTNYYSQHTAERLNVKSIRGLK